jgi:hypothetical protein
MLTMPMTMAGGAVSSKGRSCMMAFRRVGMSLPLRFVRLRFV